MPTDPAQEPISWMTITAGPVPARNTSWARPSWVNIEWSHPANEPACWVTTPPTFARCSCSQWERQQRHCQTVMSRSCAAPTTASSYGCPSGDAGTAHTDGSAPTSPPHPPANQPWPTSTPPPAGPGCPTGEPPRYSPRPAAAGPVSYTHLRAHETVLDLVCRLL